jgi:hypothetical protein
MIGIDATEARVNSRLPSLPGAVVLDSLEALTGADILISALQAPATTETLLRRHIAAGALLVQRKSGLDLVNSMGEVMNYSLARMWQAGGRQGQNVLLFSGVLSMDASGAAVVDGHTCTSSYWNVVGALGRWNDRGGVVERVDSDSLIPQWCAMRLKAVEEYAKPGGGIKSVYPPTDYPPDLPAQHDPLQLPIPVRDGRLVLAQLAGIGPKLADEIWLASGKNLGFSLTILTDRGSPDWCKLKGIGVKIIDNIRRQLGLEDTQRLIVEDTGSLKVWTVKPQFAFEDPIPLPQPKQQTIA